MYEKVVNMSEKKPQMNNFDYSGLNDVAWRPYNKPSLGALGRTRTISTDSGVEMPQSPTSPDSAASGRRFSITGMLFGSPGLNRQSSLDQTGAKNQTNLRKTSIAESVEKMIKDHRKILDDIP